MSRGKLLHLCSYWTDGDYNGAARPTVEAMEAMAAPLRHLPLIAVDFAFHEPHEEGIDMRIVEINDGGCAGVPEGGGVPEFYAAMFKEFAR